MQIDVMALLRWMWETAAAELWGALALFVMLKVLTRTKKLTSKFRTPAKEASSDLSRTRRFVRLLQKRHLAKMRKYRFDLAWIQREVSRGHICLMLCILWFSIWLLAVGLRDILNYTGVPLGQTPGAAVLAAAPLYCFEIGWVWFSSNAAQVIRHRQKTKAWRYH